MSRARVQDKRNRVRQLRVFCEAVRLRSLTRAAERLGLTQPAVSLQVRELELELGAVLFERTAAGVVPTEAGERLHALAEPLVREVDAMFGDLRRTLDSGQGGRVCLAVSSAGAGFVLPPYLRCFRERHPEAAVCLYTAAHRERLQRLLDERADLVLGTCDDYPKETVEYHEMFTYSIALITPPGHSLAGRASVSPREVDEHRSVVPSAETHSARFGEARARAFRGEANIALDIGGWGVLKRHVEAGVGVAVVPTICLQETDRVCVVALDAHLPTLSYGVFARRDTLLTPAARSLFRLLIPNAPGPPPPPPPPPRGGPHHAGDDRRVRRRARA